MANELFVELRNLFKSIENYNCFVCSDTNPIGLNLDIQHAGNQTYAVFILSNLYSGFPSVIHGGIQATIIDEIGWWTMFNQIKRLGFTKSLSVEYLSKIETEKELRVVGKVVNNPAWVRRSFTLKQFPDNGWSYSLIIAHYPFEFLREF